VLDHTKSPFQLSKDAIKSLSHRQLGIGFDQLLVVENTLIENVDFKYRIFNPKLIPFNSDVEKDEYLISIDLPHQKETINMAVLSMGNPHAVIIVKDTLQAHVETLGTYLESHALFPKRVNVGFMEIVSPHHIRLRVFERGVGETLACGTGACAAAVSGIKRHLLISPVKVEMPGGSLSIDWKGSSCPVMMKGPAVSLYEGDIEIT
jgi:diaminopimelate epimerase